MNEYNEILSCLSDVLSNENAKNKFFSTDNLDDRYEYFSKCSGKVFSKEKFKEVVEFFEDQTKKDKDVKSVEEFLKNVTGGKDKVPTTDLRRFAILSNLGSDIGVNTINTLSNLSNAVNTLFIKFREASKLDNMEAEAQKHYDKGEIPNCDTSDRCINELLK